MPGNHPGTFPPERAAGSPWTIRRCPSSCADPSRHCPEQAERPQYLVRPMVCPPRLRRLQAVPRQETTWHRVQDGRLPCPASRRHPDSCPALPNCPCVPVGVRFRVADSKTGCARRAARAVKRGAPGCAPGGRLPDQEHRRWWCPAVRRRPAFRRVPADSGCALHGELPRAAPVDRMPGGSGCLRGAFPESARCA
jgi:hypothetical protein